MSTVATHKHHVHVPWISIIAVLVAVAVAAIVLVLVNQPTTTVTEPSTAVVPATVGAAAVPLPETQAARRHLAAERAAGTALVGQAAASEPAAGGTAVPSGLGGHRVNGFTVNNPHPFNFVPGAQ